jgi:exodeoxyribonuclease VII large subunit
MNVIEDKRMAVLSLSEKIDGYINGNIERKRAGLASLASALNALNPLAVLSRGYGAVFGKNGNVVKSVADVNVGETIDLKVSDGTISATVYEVCNEE